LAGVTADDTNAPAKLTLQPDHSVGAGQPTETTMIERYRDHAANERTFLAWVRTAIAVMAFGFLVEKFDIFLAYMASQAQSHAGPLRGQRFANEAGLAFILLGVVMIVIAAARFFRIARDIDKDETIRRSGSRFDLTLAALLLLLASSLFLYMSRAVLPSF
jgi:inner membrane protein YidH